MAKSIRLTFDTPKPKVTKRMRRRQKERRTESNAGVGFGFGKGHDPIKAELGRNAHSFDDDNDW